MASSSSKKSSHSKKHSLSKKSATSKKPSSSKKSSLPPRDRRPCHGDYIEVIAIRHGETTYNADGRYQGQLDAGLNDVGKAQAADVAKRLSKERKISALYSSDLQSDYETAHIIADECGWIKIVQIPDLRERHLGVLQGMSRSEASQTNPTALKAKDNGEKIPGGGESFEQLTRRCRRALKSIFINNKAGKRVVVVTHGGLLRLLHKLVIGDTPVKIIRNTSVNVFHIYGEEWSIENWGDISHLNIEPGHNYY